MSHPLVFNHHSLPLNSADDIHPAISEFLKISLGAHRIGFTVILVDETIDKAWFRLELTQGYFWKDWHDQQSNDPQTKDLIRSFRRIATQQPLFLSQDYADDVELFDVRLPGTKKNVPALKAAAWHESPLLSFPTRPPWTDSPIPVLVEKMADDGEIVNSTEELRNLYSIAQLEKEKPELQEKVQSQIRSGKELLEQARTVYPCLCFCGKSEEQLRTWSYSSSLLEVVKDALNVLNTFVEYWHDGRIAGYTHDELHRLGLKNKVSGESESVRNNPKLRKAREFYLPTGEKTFFEYHVKFPRGIRLHFFIKPEIHTVFIGYIGEHLPL
ncbi:MAG: hypothetical protein Q3M24_20025 [Candidatus Electrothrix aestuarii]|uniref:Uncharacterized protein n=1 Tax=Candidatus Electrothrix aestuarii TaxID=3062594 RepID=A0AAU8LUK6_9BACT|nr:hypothetical protein [Candidatus Electrothrix aestuarii]